jgi:hypothetical protein
VRQRDAIHDSVDVSEPRSGKSTRGISSMVLMSVDQAKRSYSDALSKAQQMEKQPSVLERAGKVGNAFKTILSFGSMVAEVSAAAYSIQYL